MLLFWWCLCAGYRHVYLEGMEEASIFVHVAVNDITGKVRATERAGCLTSVCSDQDLLGQTVVMRGSALTFSQSACTHTTHPKELFASI